MYLLGRTWDCRTRTRRWGLQYDWPLTPLSGAVCSMPYSHTRSQNPYPQSHMHAHPGARPHGWEDAVTFTLTSPCFCLYIFAFIIEQGYSNISLQGPHTKVSLIWGSGRAQVNCSNYTNYRIILNFVVLISVCCNVFSINEFLIGAGLCNIDTSLVLQL